MVEEVGWACDHRDKRVTWKTRLTQVLLDLFDDQALYSKSNHRVGGSRNPLGPGSKEWRCKSTVWNERPGLTVLHTRLSPVPLSHLGHLA